MGAGNPSNQEEEVRPKAEKHRKEKGSNQSKESSGPREGTPTPRPDRSKRREGRNTREKFQNQSMATIPMANVFQKRKKRTK